MTDITALATKLDQIEAEMRSIGMWSDVAPSAEKFQSRVAFYGDTMSFDQWLQFVFVPRVRDVLSGASPAPKSSSVGAQAVREFDGLDKANRLTGLLGEFDRLIEG
jgi:uncharacterized protein YqcC (DUF446 family)